MSFFRRHLRTRARAIVCACLCACVYLQSHGYTAAATQLVALITARACAGCYLFRLCRWSPDKAPPLAAVHRQPPPPSKTLPKKPKEKSGGKRFTGPDSDKELVEMIERDVVEKNPEERRCASVCILACDGSAPARTSRFAPPSTVAHGCRASLAAAWRITRGEAAVTVAGALARTHARTGWTLARRVHWDDIAGCKEAKGLLEEAVVLPQLMPGAPSPCRNHLADGLHNSKSPCGRPCGCGCGCGRAWRGW